MAYISTYWLQVPSPGIIGAGYTNVWGNKENLT